MIVKFGESQPWSLTRQRSLFLLKIWNRFKASLVFLQICAFPNTPKFRDVKSLGGKIVKREWLEACHADRKRYPWRRFCLDNSDKGQGKLNKPGLNMQWNSNIFCGIILVAKFEWHKTFVKNWKSWILVVNNSRSYRPWWPSGLRRHAISQLIVATKGLQFKYHLGHGHLYGFGWIWDI